MLSCKYNALMGQPSAPLLFKSRTWPSREIFSCRIAKGTATAAAAPAPRPTLGNKSPCRPLLPYYYANNYNALLRRKNQQYQRNTSAHAAAGSTAASAGQTMLFGRAFTGIPMMELFQTMTLAEAALESSIRISFIVIAVLFGNKIIPFLGSKMNEALHVFGERHGGRRRGQLKPLVKHYSPGLGLLT